MTQADLGSCTTFHALLDQHPIWRRRITRATFALLIVVSSMGTAQALNLRVTTTADGPGTCIPSGGQIVCTTLRGAIAQANSLASNDTIFLDNSLSGSTITLTEGHLTIAENKTLTIRGDTTISGGNSSRVFNPWNGSVVTLRDLTIANGTADGSVGDHGGGIWNDGTLILERVTVRNNSAIGSGGGIYNNGTLTVRESTISNNTSLGTSRAGGGIFNWGTLNVIRSTVSNNTARDGGGIHNGTEKTLAISHSTLSGNHATSDGGGLYTNGTTTIEFTTIANNSADWGAGIRVRNGTTTIHYSVLANPNGSYDCDQFGVGTINAAWSHFQRGTSCVNGSQFILLTGDPKLGPLANNSGPTRTHLPLPGSPLIGAIPPPVTMEADQRGVARPQGTHFDIGAVEVIVPMFANGFEPL